MNTFTVQGRHYLVPFKCGYTAFCNATARGLAIQEPIPEGASVTGIIRNPMDRVFSFFRDKLRQNRDPKKVQHCQRLLMHFFHLRGVDELGLIPFDNLISALESAPQLISEPHLAPFSPLFIPHQKLTLYNLDDRDTSLWLFRLLDIDPRDHDAYNCSEGRHLKYSVRSLEILHRIYEFDFRLLLNYPPERP